MVNWNDLNKKKERPMKCPTTSLALTTLLLSVAFSPAWAAPRTIAETLEIAAHHPDIATRAARLEQAQGSLTAAKGARWFKISGDAQVGTQHYDLEDYSKNTGIAEGGLLLSQPLLDGGRRSATVEEMSQRVQEATQNLGWQQRQQQFAAAQAHTSLWLAQKLADMTRQDNDFLTRITSSTEQRFGMSDATKTEVAEANSRLDAAKAELAQRMADIGVAQANYIRAVGETVGEVADPSPAMVMAVSGTFDPTVHPLVQAAQAAHAEALARVSQAEAADWPSVDLLGSTRRNQYDGTNYDQKSTDNRVVLSMGYTFWDSGVTRGQKAEARAALQAADAELKATKLEVQSQRAAAASRWQTAGEKLVHSEAELKDATLTVQLLMKEVQMGNRELRDLLDAQRDMTAAMSNWLQAYAGRAVAWYDLRRWE
jgi:outer membrane protein TolC